MHWYKYLFKSSYKFITANIPTQVITKYGEDKDAWSLFIKPLSMQLWTVLTLHSLILTLILKALWWYYDRKTPDVKNPSIVEFGFETIHYYIMLSSAYLGKGYDRMPHNKQFVIKGNHLWF